VDYTVEKWLGLTINRTKTRVVVLTPNGDATLDFLGYTFRYDWDRRGRKQRFLTAVPSAKAVARAKSELREMTDYRRCFVPLPDLVGTINRKLRGWKAYFSFGHPRAAHRDINRFAIERLILHAHRRSQRPSRPPTGKSYYSFITHTLGYQLL